MTLFETDQSLFELNEIVRTLGDQVLKLLELVSDQAQMIVLLKAQQDGILARLAYLEEKTK